MPQYELGQRRIDPRGHGQPRAAGPLRQQNVAGADERANEAFLIEIVHAGDDHLALGRQRRGRAQTLLREAGPPERPAQPLPARNPPESGAFIAQQDDGTDGGGSLVGSCHALGARWPVASRHTNAGLPFGPFRDRTGRCL